MKTRRPPPRVRIDGASGRSLGAPEPAKRGNRNARRVPRRRSRLRVSLMLTGFGSGELEKGCRLLDFPLLFQFSYS
ncbi:hypothetical protein JEQ12_008370 [Ovis aries]|uniref:Uncharacterized protein n=1 Tax=Ovis aries TaxID=9940 RepID=A0A835ZV33_SHEEP|nr:hypothetical protein JEQ12_008370 [Ovis aries]